MYFTTIERLPAVSWGGKPYPLPSGSKKSKINLVYKTQPLVIRGVTYDRRLPP